MSIGHRGGLPIFMTATKMFLFSVSACIESESSAIVYRTHCWAMMRGMLGLSDWRGGGRSPVRKLNMGREDRGGGTPRAPAMLLSSLLLPWMVWWWYSCILQQATGGGSLLAALWGPYYMTETVQQPHWRRYIDDVCYCARQTHA